MLVQVGKTYIHNQTKGLYRVIALGKTINTTQERVLYQSLFDGNKWDRSLQAFTENVPEKGPRFSEIDFEENQLERMKEQWVPNHGSSLKDYSSLARFIENTRIFMYYPKLMGCYLVDICRNVEDLGEIIYFKNKRGEIFVQSLHNFNDDYILVG